MLEDEKTPVNETHLLQKLETAGLTTGQQKRLVAMIADVFRRAIDRRAPKNRPPGKAGLRAEKGYYRLLYIEGDFQEKVCTPEHAPGEPPIYDWSAITVTLKQLKDIPELQAEIAEGIEAAWMQVLAEDSGG